MLSFILLAGELMKIPSSALRIQICKCIVDFYHAEPLKKHIPGKFSLIFCLWETHKQKKSDIISYFTKLSTNGLMDSVPKKNKCA